MRCIGVEGVVSRLDGRAVGRRRFAPVVGALVLLVAAASCGGGDDGGAEGSASSTSSTAAESTTTTAAGFVPPELLGRWHTVLPNAEAEAVTLRFSETEFGGSWGISRGQNRASGRLEVNGDEMVFVAGSICAETGTYRWVLDGDTLRMTSIEHDPCGGRSMVLEGLTYTRGE